MTMRFLAKHRTNKENRDPMKIQTDLLYNKKKTTSLV